MHTGLIELYADRFAYVNRTGGPFGARRAGKCENGMDGALILTDRCDLGDCDLGDKEPGDA